MKQFIIFALIGLAVCDKLPTAPYEPSGWKPQGAQLALPSEYGTPAQFQKSNVEVNRENVQFAGQISETTTPQSNEYLPPAAPEVINQVS